MSYIMRCRPSPSMVVALLALLVAMGGTAFAVALPRNSVGTKQIKRKAVKRSDIGTRAVGRGQLGTRAVSRSKLGLRAVSSSRVGNDALTGKNILESSLGTVPTATSSTSATNADTVDGVNAAKINYRSAAGTAATQILNLGGLTLTATCAAGPTIDLDATTTINDAEIQVTGHSTGSVDAHGSDTDFDVGDTVDIDTVFGPSPAAGTIAYTTSGGSQVTATFQFDDVAPLGGTTGCMVGGTALYAP